MNSRVEILAPAGSMESMMAAVQAGADAIYMGGSRFGARAYADNPEEDRFLEAIDYVHLHGCRLYMTVNTLVKEEELDQLYDFLKPYYERGLDAVIVQDLGVWKFIREHFPDLPIHASTQMAQCPELKGDGSDPRGNSERVISSGNRRDPRPCGCGNRELCAWRIVLLLLRAVSA